MLKHVFAGLAAVVAILGGTFVAVIWFAWFMHMLESGSIVIGFLLSPLAALVYFALWMVFDIAYLDSKDKTEKTTGVREKT